VGHDAIKALHFASDGCVDDFEEWAYWQGKAYSVEAD